MNNSGDISFVLTKYRLGRLVYKGHVTSGVAKDAVMHLKETGRNPFQMLPTGNECVVWVKPSQVCVVEYMPNTLHSLRQPVFKGFRDDILPEDVEDISMKILVDADACPVVSIVEHVASKYRIPVILLCDTNHVLQSAYSEVKVIGAGSDAVDFALVGLCQKGDLVVTQDYGVAAMILGKGAFGIHQSGKWYTDENIDRMLMERHISKKVRRSKSKHLLRGPAKRTAEDDIRFEEALERLIQKLNEKSIL